MPNCLHCSESYSDQLRRCPYCGGAAELDGVVDSSAPGRSLSGRRGSFRPMIGAAGLLLIVCIGVVVTVQEPEEPELLSSVGPFDPSAGTSSKASAPPDETAIEPVETALGDVIAVRDGAEVFVEGACSPRAMVAIYVGGVPAVLSPTGERFELSVRTDADEIEIVATGVDGKQSKRTVKIGIPADAPRATRVPIRSHAEGQTIHVDSVNVEIDGPVRPIKSTLRLPAIANRVSLGEGRLVLFRAPPGLIYLRTTAAGHHTFLREADGTEMVLIPGGLGKRGTGAEQPHGPEHVVLLGPYLLDRTEVTCRQYAAFVQQMRGRIDASLRHPEDPGADYRPAGWADDNYPEGWGDRPVVGVSWYGAFAYSRWVGGRLPTEAEWERAAAGPLGRNYPWGDGFNPVHCQGQGESPLPAASLPDGESYYGILNMSGNAREWCGDRFDPRWYRRSSRTNPRGPSRSLHRVVRGGSFLTAPEFLRAQFRDQADPKAQKPDIGFRVAMRWAPFPSKTND